MVTLPNQRQTILVLAATVLVATSLLGLPQIQQHLSSPLSRLDLSSAIIEQTAQKQSLPATRFAIRFPADSADLGAVEDNEAVLKQAAAAINGLGGMIAIDLVWLGAPDPLLSRRGANAHAAIQDALPNTDHKYFVTPAEEQADLEADTLLLTIRVRSPDESCPNPIVIADQSLPGSVEDPDQAVAMPLPAKVIARGSADVHWRVDDGPWTALSDRRPPQRCGSDLFLSTSDSP